MLKKGAQVMFVRNDASPAHQYYNGRIGQVKTIDDDCILVHCEGDEFDISVERQVWENTRYVINEKTKEIEPQVQGAFTQYPLRLAWAITIHKSQGLTFEHAIIDAGASFASGQVYVALSRCKTLEGLVLASPLHAHAILNDHRVDAYIEQQEHAAEESIVKLPYLKQDYYRQQLLELFNFRDIMQAEEALNRAAIEWLHAYPKLQMLHKATLQSMQTQVADVAAKWLKFIAQQSFEALQDEAFVERMQKSVGYFIAQLNTYLRPLLAQTKEAKVGNKQGVERLQTTYAELRVAYLSKYYLLTAILKAGFQAESYLKLRQKCFLEALDEVESSPEPTKRQRQRTTEKPKTEKPAKVNTREITRQLFEEGKTIAALRFRPLRAIWPIMWRRVSCRLLQSSGRNVTIVSILLLNAWAHRRSARCSKSIVQITSPMVIFSLCWPKKSFVQRNELNRYEKIINRFYRISLVDVLSRFVPLCKRGTVGRYGCSTSV